MLDGVLPALATPFAEHESGVDHRALRRLVEQLIRDGANGVVACGTTGEFATLRAAERKAIVETVIDQVAGRIAVVAQTGSCSTADAVELSLHAAACGADAILVAAPYFGAPTSDEVFGYYADIAAATDLPICVYHFPAATGFDGGLEFILRVASEIETVQYVKDSTGDLGLLARIVEDTSGRLTMLCGEELLVLPSLLLGVTGFVLGSGNFLSPGFVAMANAAVSGDLTRASAINSQLMPIMRTIVDGPYVGTVKTALQLLGNPVGSVRKPQVTLDAEQTAALSNLLSTLDPTFLTAARETADAP